MSASFRSKLERLETQAQDAFDLVSILPNLPDVDANDVRSYKFEPDWCTHSIGSDTKLPEAKGLGS
jgi:predicted NUDIX family NTP pyrophosphohydrolase